MPTRTTTYITAITLLLSTAFTASAQDKKTSPAVRGSSKVRTLLMPDFYHFTPVVSNDTTFRYELIGRDNKLVNIALISRIDDAAGISYVKSYFLSAYKAGSTISPPYLSQKITFWDRLSKDSWLKVDQLNPKNNQCDVKEYRSKIVRQEQVSVMNPATGQKEPLIIKYFKTVTSGAGNTPHAHTHAH